MWPESGIKFISATCARGHNAGGIMIESDKPRLLLVDDEVQITKALHRLFRSDYHVVCCDNGKQALCELAKDEFTIIISDMRMPQMDGATVLAKAREISPDTIRVLLTGQCDLESTIRAVNEGQIFNYISKPWDNRQLQFIIKSAAEHYNMRQQLTTLNHKLAAKNQLLTQVNAHLEEKIFEQGNALKCNKQMLLSEAKKQRQMFQNLLNVINTIISEHIHDAQGHNKRIAMQAKMMAQALKLNANLCNQIYLAGLLADIGKVSIDHELITLPEQQLDAAQFHHYQQYVTKGAELLKALPEQPEVAQMVKHQCECYSGGGYPDRLKNSEIPLGSRILLIVKDFDKLLLGRKNSHKLTISQAKAYLQEHSGHLYDPKLVKLFISQLKRMSKAQQQGFDYAVSSHQLRVGSTLAQDVYFDNGGVFLPKGSAFTEQLIEKIRNHEMNHSHNFTFFVS